MGAAEPGSSACLDIEVSHVVCASPRLGADPLERLDESDDLLPRSEHVEHLVHELYADVRCDRRRQRVRDDRCGTNGGGRWRVCACFKSRMRAWLSQDQGTGCWASVGPLWDATQHAPWMYSMNTATRLEAFSMYRKVSGCSSLSQESVQK